MTRNAQDEHNFDLNLLAVTERWHSSKIHLLDYELVKGTHNEAIFDVVELQALQEELDESLINLKKMQQSPFARQFGSKIALLENWLQFTKELLPALEEN